MAQADLQLFGGSWTERKLDAVNQYLRAYAKALKNQPFQRVYIDAFAGTGYREQRSDPSAQNGSMFDVFEGDDEPQRFLDGSARIALKVEPPFTRYVFIEMAQRRAAELAKLRLEFPSRADTINVQCGDANAAIQALCRSWNTRLWRGVLFLDPYGMQVEWPTIEAIAKTQAIDVWILFPFAVNRLLTRYPQDIPAGWRDRLNKMFGSEDWQDRFYKTKTSANIFSGPEEVVEKALTLQGLGAYYRERLDRVFAKVAPNPRMLLNSRNSPLFQLHFAAGNPGRGGEIALRIAEHILNNI